VSPSRREANDTEGVALCEVCTEGEPDKGPEVPDQIELISPRNDGAGTELEWRWPERLPIGVDACSSEAELEGAPAVRAETGGLVLLPPLDILLLRSSGVKRSVSDPGMKSSMSPSSTALLNFLPTPL